mmetsp:Transcript_35595/g.83208  ORF Transcript_35595/g.83208 Transcript_35595/m.83208 type:complete len:267 (-) Transcript_35595:67-867(-)
MRHSVRASSRRLRAFQKRCPATWLLLLLVGIAAFAAAMRQSSACFFGLKVPVPPLPVFDNTATKNQLLELIQGTERGLNEPEGRREEILSAFEALERSNPTAAPLESELLKGEWELLWTTSESILGTSRPPFLRPKGDSQILQFLDPAKGVGRNLEDTPVSRNMVEAEIVPLLPENRARFANRLETYLPFRRPGGSEPLGEASLERSAVGVQFRKFSFFGGLVSAPAPEQATGILEITYLDDDLRLSRGDKGNLFILRKIASERSV